MSTKPKLNPWGPYKTFQVKPRVTYEMYTGLLASSSIIRQDEVFVRCLPKQWVIWTHFVSSGLTCLLTDFLVNESE